MDLKLFGFSRELGFMHGRQAIKVQLFWMWPHKAYKNYLT